MCDFPDVVRALFFKEIAGLLAGSTQSKQWRIELLYRYKRVKINRITGVQNPVKLRLHSAITRADFVSWCMLYTYKGNKMHS